MSICYNYFDSNILLFFLIFNFNNWTLQIPLLISPLRICDYIFRIYFWKQSIIILFPVNESYEKWKSPSCVQFFVTTWYQSMEVSRPECWDG